MSTSNNYIQQSTIAACELNSSNIDNLYIHGISFVVTKVFLQGVVDILCEACAALNWKNPSKIQREAIPLALKGN